jgi:DNA helicase-2/ATP-dependent DNA helicase PcrA
MNLDGEIKEGNLKFLYSTKNDISKAKSLLGWDFSNSKNSKELNLTHNLIATKAGFGELMRIYDGDKVLGYVKRIKAYIKDKEPETSVEEKTFGEVVSSLKQGKSAKELKDIDPTAGMLTYIGKHKAIFDLACSLPYRDLASLFLDKDHLLDDKKNSEDEVSKTGSNRDDLIKHLFRIQKNVQLYLNGQFNEFLRVTDREINSLQDKIDLKREMDGFVTLDGKSIGQVIEEANKSGIVRIDDRLLNFKTRRHYIYEQVVSLPYLEFQNLFKYLEGSTPFSTQHKTKGSEFSNVFVVLNNGNWNKYNFEYLFTDRTDKESVMARTQKIFYVCCTRAKENLAVFYESPTTEVLAKAREWFGSKNVINLDSDIEI